eukprot:TRINITY_DN1894_c0_g1_i1.p2 TRINITY_DN1894_c0_g1~~TRINITY_DN1894_c0_g1_i1.p2  ORF type:complete len:122 (+),score=52.61 TRINITY_DN1894_c0_g1_i1:523-888(+)
MNQSFAFIVELRFSSVWHEHGDNLLCDIHYAQCEKGDITIPAKLPKELPLRNDLRTEMDFLEIMLSNETEKNLATQKESIDKTNEEKKKTTEEKCNDPSTEKRKKYRLRGRSSETAKAHRG